MLIAKNIRQLRLNKSITQEELAERIGVTGQAVSKWERDECYPDITLLPGLANYFGVTLDKLVGMDELNNENLRRNIDAKISDLSKEGNYREAVEYAEQMLKNHPNDYGLMGSVAQLSALDGIVNERTIRLCELAAENDANEKRRATTIAGLCVLYKMNNEIKKAQNLALIRPHCRESRELLYPKFLEQPERDVYLREHIPFLLLDIASMIKNNESTSDMHTIRVGDYNNHISTEDSINIIKEFLMD